jgi:hypothetical protein
MDGGDNAAGDVTVSVGLIPPCSPAELLADGQAAKAAKMQDVSARPERGGREEREQAHNG